MTQRSYSEMMIHYTEFTVFAPGVGGTSFTGMRGEREKYDQLIRVPEARGASATSSAATIPTDAPSAAYRTHTAASSTENRSASSFSLPVGGSSRMHTKKAPRWEMEIGNVDEAAIHEAVGPSRYASIADDMGALRKAASRAFDARVALVTDLRVSPLRSLVVIDKRAYGLSLMPCPRMLESGLARLQYYQLEPIGRNLLVCRADGLVSPLRNFDAYSYTRASQIGVR